MKIPEGDVLIFDLEARPTAWIASDYVGRTMTAYAYMYLHDDEVTADAITHGVSGMRHFEKMVIEVSEAVENASLVVGHWVRGYDLPLLNGDLERVGQHSLPRLLTVDTKSDRLQTEGISQSLENLAARYELEIQKMDMREPYWEEFNLWQTWESREKVLARVESDIRATKELYVAMLEAGRLKRPSAWDPTTSKIGRYRP